MIPVFEPLADDALLLRFGSAIEQAHNTLRPPTVCSYSCHSVTAIY
jgi:hypothetical protein